MTKLEYIIHSALENTLMAFCYDPGTFQIEVDSVFLLTFQINTEH